MSVRGALRCSMYPALASFSSCSNSRDSLNSNPARQRSRDCHPGSGGRDIDNFGCSRIVTPRGDKPGGQCLALADRKTLLDSIGCFSHVRKLPSNECERTMPVARLLWLAWSLPERLPAARWIGGISRKDAVRSCRPWNQHTDVDPDGLTAIVAIATCYVRPRSVAEEPRASSRMMKAVHFEPEMTWWMISNQHQTSRHQANRGPIGFPSQSTNCVRKQLLTDGCTTSNSPCARAVCDAHTRVRAGLTQACAFMRAIVDRFGSVPGFCLEVGRPGNGKNDRSRSVGAVAGSAAAVRELGRHGG